MKKILSVVSISIVLLLFGLKYSKAIEFTIIRGLHDRDFYTVTAEGSIGDRLFAGSGRAIFKKEDLDSKWEKIYTIKGQNTKVNSIYKDEFNNNIYAATASGLFVSQDGGRKFSRNFRGQDSRQNKVNYVTISNDLVLIGTGNGFFYSKVGTNTWIRLRILPEDIEVFWIETLLEDENIYIAASDGVYKIKKDLKESRKIFNTQRLDISEFSKRDSDIEEIEYSAFMPKVVKIDKLDSDILYLGTTDGLFISNDRGRSWNRAFSVRLGRASIRNIIQDNEINNILYLVTDRGFLKTNIEDGSVKQLYKGLTTNNINDAIYSNDKFILATDKGLFETRSNASFIDITKKHKEYFLYEPTIREVRKAAIRYNDISSEKITQWHEASRKKVFLPDLRFKVGGGKRDRYQGSTVNPETDRWVRYHEDINWDVTFSWDLGDMVWSTSQTSIDVRSRLNTQTRINILEEVNRLYFERYRLKLQILSKPAETEKEEIERQLRLKELTAALDSYTGDFFTERSKELMMEKR